MSERWTFCRWCYYFGKGSAIGAGWYPGPCKQHQRPLRAGTVQALSHHSVSPSASAAQKTADPSPMNRTPGKKTLS